MAVLTYAQIESNVLDVVQANVTTDKPITTGAGSELERCISRAFAEMWEVSGGGVKKAASAALWTPAQTASADGVLVGVATDINEILDVWATLTSGSTGGAAADIPLKRREREEIMFLRANGTALATYVLPKLYSITRLSTATPGDVNKVQLDYYPGISGYYFPAHYVPQFTPIDAATVTTPDLNDLESYDLVYIAAIELAPLIGRAELAPLLAVKISEKTRLALDRKYSALSEGKQDR